MPDDGNDTCAVTLLSKVPHHNSRRTFEPLHMIYVQQLIKKLDTKGWSDEDAGRKVEDWLDLISLIAGGRGCSVTEVANFENVGQDCGNGTKALDSTEKTIEGTKKKTQLIGISSEKTGLSLEKVEQIMYLPS
ncbi:hypothetical protein AVEN_136135-1 [Araneus ventricosus]|uniref:Uncharacterized protein n=1 Tax=Araneus ventricosus TaxID=182803 RepID=A0A4Y2RT60_ARAVE|nr:hypothetical protein AVEN_40567-1 [Araneus ventricosus]GBN79064.1 hypothetical protein AVEN_136135-1 [Araneus ventricosus]